jgi:hypothetical protein
VGLCVRVGEKGRSVMGKGEIEMAEMEVVMMVLVRLV